MAKKLHLLLMGKTGHGKSATGNSLLGRKAFAASADVSSKTFEVQDDYAEFKGYTLHVIDGPGLADTGQDKVKDKERAVKNMNAAIGICSQGVDAFLIVLRFGVRFTPEEREALEALKKIFGDSYFNHIIVVVTGGDNFPGAMEEEGRDIDFHQWCKEETAEIRKLYDDCQGRFVLLNNREKDEEKKAAQVLEVVRLAEDLQSKHGRYTSECFLQAKAQREKMIVEQKAPGLREEIQEKVGLLTTDILKYREKPSESLKENIRKRIQAIRNEVVIADKGYNVLSDLLRMIDRVEQNLGDVEKLQSLGKELEYWRKVKTILSVTWKIVSFVGSCLSLICLPAGTAAMAAAVFTGLTDTATAIGNVIASDEESKLEKEIMDIKCKLK